MTPTPPPVPTPPAMIPAGEYSAMPGSRSLIAAAILCFIAAPVPLIWLAFQLSNLQQKSMLAAFMGLRLPFRAVFIEEIVCTAGLAALLIVCGVLLLARARWAVHFTGAVMGVVIVGGLAATIAEIVRRLTDDSPRAAPPESHFGEIALRTVAVVVWPMVIAILLGSRSILAAIVDRRGSLPSIGGVEFASGVVLIWFGLAATSIHRQSIPYDIFFGRIVSDTPATVWRVAFAVAWVIAGVLMIRGRKGAGIVAILVTAAAIASEVMLAVAGGTEALADRTIADRVERFEIEMATPFEPDSPWLAALYRGAGPLCLLLFLLAPYVLFVDEPDETAAKDQGRP